MTNHEEIQHWVDKASKGDKIAFGYLVNFYQKLLLQWIGGMVGTETAKDLVQDVFVKVYFCMHTFRGDSSFKTWLYSIAYRMTISYLRKEKQDANKLNVYSENPNYTDENNEDEFLELENALKKLNPEAYMLLNLYYFQKKNVKETADIAGLSESNTKIKLFRIRNILKEMIEKERNGNE